MKRIIFFLFLISPFLAVAQITVPSNGTIIRVAPDSSSLPELGLYGNKLRKLQESVASAREVFQKKHNAARAGRKGGEVLDGDHNIDGPLYLLRKMEKNLETDLPVHLKDGQGLSKFFAHLRALKAYNNPALAELIQSTQEFTGFSYFLSSSLLFPDKPMLIFIPPTGEPVAWSQFLGRQNANVVGYVYDNTASADEMITTLLAKLKDAGLDNQPSVMMAYSFGNTVLLRTAEQAISSGDDSFAQTAFISLGFLPGGASDFLGFAGKLPFIRSIGPVLYPPSAGIFDMLPPDTSSQGPQARLVNNLARIDEKTLGISYVQSQPEGEYHIKQNSTHPFYGPTVNQFFREMEAAKKITYVSENHWGIPDAPAVKEVIDKSLAVVSKRKPGAFLFQYFALQLVPNFTLYKSSTAYTYSLPFSLAAVGASSIINSQPDILDVIPALLGGTIDKCDVLMEALENGILQIPGTTYGKTADAVRGYIAESKIPCTFDEIEKDARAALQSDGFIITTPNNRPSTPTLTDLADESIFDTVSVDLKVNGQDGPIEVEKKARIVLSWISDGATRCRGVWSKKDLKLSGTSAGRISRSATIKIACINADGELAEDSVGVNITE
ncbi:MAG: hypothetical protein G01um101417_433 [Parcubacteria group bacterium Gr01-1014_17]|nr:MAG: hypothetical protein G01um101417_433 [Parcubacteria group bacterium Gr01-1014_17]